MPPVDDDCIQPPGDRVFNIAELVTLIVECIDFPEDVLTVALINRTSCQAAIPRLWHEFSISSWIASGVKDSYTAGLRNNVDCVKHLVAWQPQTPGNRRLEMTPWKHLADPDIWDRCSALSLRMRVYDIEHQLAQLMMCRSLRYIHLVVPEIDDGSDHFGMIAGKCPNLMGLTYKVIQGNVNVDKVSAILKPGFEWLEIDDGSSVLSQPFDGRHLQRLINTVSRHEDFIFLHCWPYQVPTGLQEPARWYNMRFLKLSIMGDFPFLCETIHRMKKLQYLNIGGAYPHATIDILHALSACHELCSLDIGGTSHSPHLDDASLVAIGTGCRKLKHLSIHVSPSGSCTIIRPKPISPTAITQFTEYAPDLRAFHLTHPISLTASAFASFSKPKNLSQLLLNLPAPKHQAILFSPTYLPIYSEKPFASLRELSFRSFHENGHLTIPEGPVFDPSSEPVPGFPGIEIQATTPESVIHIVEEAMPALENLHLNYDLWSPLQLWGGEGLDRLLRRRGERRRVIERVEGETEWWIRELRGEMLGCCRGTGRY